MLALKEPKEGPWVPFDDGPLQLSNATTTSSSSQVSQTVDRREETATSSVPRARPAGRRNAHEADPFIDEQDQPSILPVKSLDTGVINVSGEIYASVTRSDR